MRAVRTLVAATFLAAAGRAAAACTISAASGPAFGTYDPLARAPLDAVGTIAYRCTPPRPVVWLSTGSSGTYAYRTLRSGAAELRYNLYVDASRTAVWGDGSGGTATDSPTPGNVTRTVAVYGRIAPLQDAAAGVYSDTIVVTFVF